MGLVMARLWRWTLCCKDELPLSLRFGDEAQKTEHLRDWRSSGSENRSHISRGVRGASDEFSSLAKDTQNQGWNPMGCWVDPESLPVTTFSNICYSRAVAMTSIHLTKICSEASLGRRIRLLSMSCETNTTSRWRRTTAVFFDYKVPIIFIGTL